MSIFLEQMKNKTPQVDKNKQVFPHDVKRGTNPPSYTRVVSHGVGPAPNRKAGPTPGATQESRGSKLYLPQEDRNLQQYIYTYILYTVQKFGVTLFFKEKHSFFQ